MVAYLIVQFLVAALVIASSIFVLTNPLQRILSAHLGGIVSDAFYKLWCPCLAVSAFLTGVGHIHGPGSFRYGSGPEVPSCELEWFVLMHNTAIDTLYGILPTLIVTTFSLLVLTLTKVKSEATRDSQGNF